MYINEDVAAHVQYGGAILIHKIEQILYAGFNLSLIGRTPTRLRFFEFLQTT